MKHLFLITFLFIFISANAQVFLRDLPDDDGYKNAPTVQTAQAKKDTLPSPQRLKIGNLYTKEFLGVKGRNIIFSYTLSFAAGVIHGGREAYHTDPTVFEKRWGVEPGSWWGSESWRRKYHTNGSGQLVERPLFGTTLSDFWHTSQYVTRGLTIGATFTHTLYRGKRQRAWWEHTLIGIGQMIVYTGGAAMAYEILSY